MARQMYSAKSKAAVYMMKRQHRVAFHLRPPHASRVSSERTLPRFGGRYHPVRSIGRCNYLEGTGHGAARKGESHLLPRAGPVLDRVGGFQFHLLSHAHGGLGIGIAQRARDGASHPAEFALAGALLLRIIPVDSRFEGWIARMGGGRQRGGSRARADAGARSGGGGGCRRRLGRARLSPKA